MPACSSFEQQRSSEVSLRSEKHYVHHIVSAVAD